MTRNQIYNSIRSDLPYNQWVTSEKNDYQNRVNSGQIKTNLDFDNWLNRKYQMKMRQEAAADGSLLNTFTDILQKTSDKIQSGVGDINNINSIPTPPKKTILGLQPVVFYSITIVTIAAITLGVYKIVHKKD